MHEHYELVCYWRKVTISGDRDVTEDSDKILNFDQFNRYTKIVINWVCDITPEDLADLVFVDK